MDSRLLIAYGMSTQPVAYESLLEVGDVHVADDVHAEKREPIESFNVIRGILFGIALSLPLWAGVFWFLRSL